MKYKSYDTVLEYANSIVKGRKIDSGLPAFPGRSEYDFNPKDAEFVIGIIEKTFVHMQGERLDGTPLPKKSPLIVLSKEIFLQHDY